MRRAIPLSFLVGLLVSLGPVSAQDQSASEPCPEGHTPAPPAVDRAEHPPKIRRGQPEDYRREQDPGAEEPGCVPVHREVLIAEEGRIVDSPVRPPGWDAFLEAARERAFSFSDNLPNFICEQQIFRFESETSPPRWQLQDRLSLEVLLVDGQESYQNIRRNGKKLKRKSPADSGQWSTGEFSTVMQDLFRDNSRPRFRAAGTEKIGGTQVALYDYRVPEDQSHWRVQFGGRSLYPAYEGSVWIDAETMRVMRVEMLARELPGNFAVDTLEMTVDYGPVRIAGEEHLMPVKAENLACWRRSATCARNEIEFRNYRRFTAESIITTTDSTVEYEK